MAKVFEKDESSSEGVRLLEGNNFNNGCNVNLLNEETEELLNLVESKEDLLNANYKKNFRPELKSDVSSEEDTKNGNFSPQESNILAETSSKLDFESDQIDEDQEKIVDCSLADFEDAALRYASLQMSQRENPSSNSSFVVQSRGWLPLENLSSDPQINSTNVEACIQHLSKSHGQILDGVGAWGPGRDLLLKISDGQLKLHDLSNKVELHTQSIKQIKVWGVGHGDASDFAFVAKDELTKTYKCHVLRCDGRGPDIAEHLHVACSQLSQKSKKLENSSNKQQLALSTPIPKPNLVTSDYQVLYLGSEKVQSLHGMETIKNVIRNITTSDVALCIEAVASVSNAALVVKATSDGHVIVHCRIRCLSFMGIGDDISLFAFISVVGDDAVCHVLQCSPVALRLSVSVQEACCLRYEKALDTSKKPQETPSPTVSRRWSFRKFVSSVFSNKPLRRSVSSKK